MFILVRPHALLSWIAAGVALAVATTAPARGDFVAASNLGANDSYSVNSGYTLLGLDTPGGVGLNLAVQFTPGGTTGSSVFLGARLPLGYRFGLNAVDVQLRSDANNLPGAVLETIRLTDLSTTTSLVTATSTTRSLLVTGRRYWLAVVVASDTQVAWAANTLGQSGHLASQLAIGEPSTIWLPNINPDTAYSVIASTAAVPEPGSLAMAACGLGGVLVIHRLGLTRRRRAGL